MTGHDTMPGNWRWGWVFVAIWLVYLLGTLDDALHADRLVSRVVGTAAVIAFGGLYVVAWSHVRRLRRAGGRASQRYRCSVLATALVLVVAAAVTAGESALAMLVFFAALTMFLLPVRYAVALSAACVGVAFVLPRTISGWQPDDDAAVGIAFASLAMFGIVQMLNRNAELAAAQRELAALAVVSERSRFARDLHDIVGHSLTVLAVKAELAGRLLDAGDGDHARREVADVERLAREALVDVRSAVRGYRQVSLAGELSSARAALDAAGIEAQLPGAIDAVPADRRELFGWAVREGVTNVVRHSGARRCVITVGADGIEVVDDGLGPPGAPLRGGAEAGNGDDHGEGASPGARSSGLAGLAERASAVGARVVAGRRDDGAGFRLRVGW